MWLWWFFYEIECDSWNDFRLKVLFSSTFNKCPECSSGWLLNRLSSVAQNNSRFHLHQCSAYWLRCWPWYGVAACIRWERRVVNPSKSQFCLFNNFGRRCVFCFVLLDFLAPRWKRCCLSWMVNCTDQVRTNHSIGIWLACDRHGRWTDENRAWFRRRLGWLFCFFLAIRVLIVASRI